MYHQFLWFTKFVTKFVTTFVTKFGESLNLSLNLSPNLSPNSSPNTLGNLPQALSALLRFGIIKGTIKRMDVNDAIKPNQLVFHGDKIEGCQFSGNVLDSIAERARKCTNPTKPRILFDFDHRWAENNYAICKNYWRMNSETFCNKIFFDINYSVPTKGIRCKHFCHSAFPIYICSGILGCINALRCYCDETKTLMNED